MRKCEGRNSEMKKPLVRQVVFMEDASLSDVPAPDSERPQLEKQEDLFQYAKDQDNLKRISNNT